MTYFRKEVGGRGRRVRMTFLLPSSQTPSVRQGAILWSSMSWAPSVRIPTLVRGFSLSFQTIHSGCDPQHVASTVMSLVCHFEICSSSSKPAFRWQIPLFLPRAVQILILFSLKCVKKEKRCFHCSIIFFLISVHFRTWSKSFYKPRKCLFLFKMCNRNRWTYPWKLSLSKTLITANKGDNFNFFQKDI